MAIRRVGNSISFDIEDRPQLQEVLKAALDDPNIPIPEFEDDGLKYVFASEEEAIAFLLRVCFYKTV